MNGNRKETVELVPLNEHDTSSKALSSPDRTGGNTLNGSIHSLHRDLPDQGHFLPAIRMSASATQLQTSNHHLNDSISSINRSKQAGSSKSLAVTIGEQYEQRQRARSGIVANGAVGAGTTANGTVINGLTEEGDITSGSTGSLSQSKRVSKLYRTIDVGSHVFFNASHSYISAFFLFRLIVVSF